MVIDEFYNYITLMTFEILYKYEDKKSISVDKLKTFRNALFEEVLDIYKNNDRGHNYLQEEDKWQGEVTFNRVDEEEGLSLFLEEYDNYFYLDKGVVSLKENVTYDDVFELLRHVRVSQKVPNRFRIVEDNKHLMGILGVSTVEKAIEKYSKIEEKLENLYNKLFTSQDNEGLRKEIKKYLFMRFSFFHYVSKLPYYKVEAFQRTAINYSAERTAEYDKCPIDLNLWESEYADPEDIYEHIEDRIYDMYQYAIFGKKKQTLHLDKIEEELNTLCFFGLNEEEFDFTKDYSDVIETDILANIQFEEAYEKNSDNFATLHDPSEEELVFFMNYLNKINNFMAYYEESEDLLSAKRRLLYVLDNPDLVIFNENNFNKVLNDTKSIELDEDPFWFFEGEIYFMVQEVFLTLPNEFTIRKLLLVSTYYDLTKDDELKEVIEDFKTDSKYEFFYDVMFNDGVDKRVDLSENIKQLIFTKGDTNKPQQ